jgi:hypothetical protein
MSKNLEPVPTDKEGEKVSEIRMFNNSQGICISYKFSNGNLEMAEKTSDCSGSYSNYTPLASGVTGGFNVQITNAESDPKKIGRAAILMQTIDKETSMQTTVSFRDYTDIIYEGSYND